MADSNTESFELLGHIEDLGEGTQFASRIFDLVGQSPFFAEFEREDIDLLADYMRVYRAQPGQSLIREGEEGDFMLMILSGMVDISKNSTDGERQLMTTVGPGHTLGEMSMIDGEPRFATCEAADTVTFAVLTRDSMANIILEKPSLGAKILIKLVTLLSQRLRHTSAQLLKLMGRTRMM
jgi:CRP-like cAMP-binding protein